MHARTIRRRGALSLAIGLTACGLGPGPSSSLSPAKTAEPAGTLARPRPEVREAERVAVVALPAHDAPPSCVSDPDTLTFALTGDVIEHEDIRKAVAVAEGADEVARYGSLFSAASGLFARADVAFVNMESPVTSRDKQTGPMTFHADATLFEALVASGVTLASLANNHALDQGPKGLADTLAAVAKANVLGVGAAASLRAACAPVMIEQKGIRVAVLARTVYMNGPLERVLGPDRVCRFALGPLGAAVRKARPHADLVVVSLHWGNEYETKASEGQRLFARYLVSAGADMIVGHHPHVLQEVAWVSAGGRRGLVAYSLGNFLSGQGRHLEQSGAARDSLTRDAAVLQVSARRDESGKVVLSDPSAVAFWTERKGDALRLVSPHPEAERVARALGVPLEAPPPRPCVRRAAVTSAR